MHHAALLKAQFVVLLAPPRSGTHLFTKILMTDPTIECAFECFYPVSAEFDKPERTLNFWKFLRDSGSIPEAMPLTPKMQEASWNAYLEFLSNRTPGNLIVLDFKYDLLRTADAGSLWPEEVPTMLRLAMRDRLPIVHLKRRNQLEMLCSFRFAQKTNEWVKFTAKTGTINGIQIDPAKLLSNLTAMQRREELVATWVQDYGARIELVYEDLLVDGRLSSRARENVERLLSRKIKINPKPQTLKISPPLDKLIENYAEIEKVLTGTPYAAFLPRKKKGTANTSKPTIGMAEKKELPESKNWFSTKILSSGPLITLTAISTNMRDFDVLARGAPEVFDTSQALHLLHLTHTLETGGARHLAGSLAEVQKLLPGHVFLPLTATENETFCLAQHGIPSLLASGLIFVDETLWRPRPDDIPGLPMFDAVYVARLDPGKRHELAQGIDRLMLIYGYALSQPPAEAYARVRALLPKAFYANHRLSKGGDLEQAEICRLFGHSRVGLCLSAVEGCMRVSMEYLLAGLPVVSTPSIGGRDRYYVAPYCRIADPHPDSVAAAVRDLAEKNLNHQKIRHHVAQMVGFDRYNFLINVNKIAKLHLGKDNLIPSMAPMIGAIAHFVPTAQVIANIRNDYAALINKS